MRNSHAALASFGLMLLLSTAMNFAVAQNAENPSQLLENFTRSDLFANQQIYSVVIDTRGLVYFGTTNGILEYDGVEWREISVSNNGAIYKLHVNEQGRVYAGGAGEFGYLFVDDAGNTRYLSISDDSDTGFDSRIIEIISIDQDVFFITSNRAYLYQNRELTRLGDSGSFSSAAYFNGTVFVIDENRGLLKFHEENGFEAVPNGGNHRANVLLTISDQKMLIVTNSRGVWQLEINGDQISITPWDNDMHDFFVSNRFSSAAYILGKMYIFGTFNNGIIILNADGELIKHINTDTGLINNMVFDVYVSNRNILWAGMLQGAALIRLPVLLPDLQIRARDESLSKDTLPADTVKDDLPSTNWQKVTEAIKFWFSHLMFWRDDATVELTVNNEGEFATIIRRVEYIRTDSLIFGGAFAHEAFGVQVLDQADTVDYVFPHDINEFRFSYASNQFENSEDIEYQVLLEGLDQDWSLFTQNTFREYTNLNWGNYIFRVRAINADEEFSREASFSFRIKPPWYEAVWFYMAQLGTLLLFIVISFFLNKSGRALGVSETLISIVVIITFKYLTLYVSPYLFQYSQGIAIFHVGISIVLGLSLKPIERGFRWTLNKFTGYTDEELEQIQQDYKDRKAAR